MSRDQPKSAVWNSTSSLLRLWLLASVSSGMTLAFLVIGRGPRLDAHSLASGGLFLDACLQVVATSALLRGIAWGKSAMLVASVLNVAKAPAAIVVLAIMFAQSGPERLELDLAVIIAAAALGWFVLWVRVAVWLLRERKPLTSRAEAGPIGRQRGTGETGGREED